MRKVRTHRGDVCCRREQLTSSSNFYAETEASMGEGRADGNGASNGVPKSHNLRLHPVI